jgi:hypothetical protein
MKTPLTLYPHLAVSVNQDYLTQDDLVLLCRLAACDCENSTTQPKSLPKLFTPRVIPLGSHSYQLLPIGSEYAKPAQQQILNNWRLAGASNKLLSIIAAAQNQLIRRLLVEPEGMIPEKRQPAKIGKIGKRKLKHQDIQSLLHSLKFSYQHDWPIEQLANIVKTYAKKTRRGKNN